MAYLLLYGNGWTQRWRIADDRAEQVRAQLAAVGTDETGQLAVRDPASDAEATLFVSWSSVTAAVVLEGAPGSAEEASAGQYP